MNKQSNNRSVTVLTIIIAVLIVIVFYFAYDMFTAADMVRNGDLWMAIAVAYVGFALILSCGLVLSGRALIFRILASFFLLSGGTIACTTGAMMDATQAHIYTNGTISDAFAVEFATLGWTASGAIMAIIAIVIVATARWTAKNTGNSHKIIVAIFALLAVIAAAAPFIYAYADANYLEPARGERNFEEWTERNPYLSEQLEKRGLFEEDRKNIVDGDHWYAGISSGDWRIEYADWKIIYDAEHDYWRAWTSPNDDLTVYAYEDIGYGVTTYPDYEESNRVHVMVDHIDANSLASIIAAIGDQDLRQGNFKLENGKLISYAVSDEQRQQAKSTYDNRGFPNDATGGFSWTDENGLQWTIYLAGEKSYASTYTMSNNHYSVDHTVIVAQDPSYVISGNNVDVIKVERLDVSTLNSKSIQAQKLLEK